MSKESEYRFSSKVLLEPIFWSLLIALIGYITFMVEFGFLYGILLIPIGLIVLLNYFPNSLRKTYYYIRDKPAIIITAENVVDNINDRQYNWSDIYDIGYHPYRKTIDITIGELNKKKYIEMTSWFLPRLLLKLNLDISQGTFHIGKQYSDVNDSLLNELIQMHDSLKKERGDAQDFSDLKQRN